MRRLLFSVLPVLFACSSAPSTASAPEEQEADTNESFFAIPKAEGADLATSALRVRSLPPTSGSDSVYIAINRKELTSKWFLSAYMEKFSPGGVGFAAAATLGTRIVTMREQNAKLYFFDAGASKAASKVGDQELVIDAYPVVDPASIGSASKYPKKDWVIIDPGVSQNPYTFVQDLFGAYLDAKFETQISYQQGFKKLSDGVEFQQVFSGNASTAVFDGSVDPNKLHAEGTINLALRRYHEGKNFQPGPDASKPFYFTNGTWNGTTLTGANATSKWNIAPGMKPIKWVISRNVLDTMAASGNQYDLFTSIKNGIEGWNAVFGYKVLEASLAAPGDHIGDDTLNFLEWDTDPSLPYAFANGRTNPDTGEMRGASIYVSSVFFNPDEFADDPAVAATNARQFLGTFGERPSISSVGWGGLSSRPGCSLFVGDALGHGAKTALFGGPKGSSKLTKKEKVEAFIQHVVLHEVGHTMGLRHNFKGSIVPDGTVPTSAMEYILDEDSVARKTPGPYDTDAIKFLYGLSTTEPTQPFCTDEDVATDPDCNTFDRSDDPLHKYYAPYHQHLAQLTLTGAYSTDEIGPYLSTSVNDISDYARAGTTSQATDAFNVLYTGIAVGQPLGGTADKVEFVSRLVNDRLYVDGPEKMGDIKGPPRPEVAPLAIVQLSGILLNVDNGRTYPARRDAVDVLKKMQTDAALKTLVDARAALVAASPGLPAADQLLTNDLIARIDSVTRPYY